MGSRKIGYGMLKVSLNGHKFHVAPDRTVYYFNKGRGLRKVTDPDVKSAVYMKIYADHGQQKSE